MNADACIRECEKCGGVRRVICEKCRVIDVRSDIEGWMQERGVEEALEIEMLQI